MSIVIKTDIIENTYISDVKFHNFIDLHKKLIIPSFDKGNLNDNLKEYNCNVFIKYMIFMCLTIEKHNTKILENNKINNTKNPTIKTY